MKLKLSLIAFFIFPLFSLVAQDDQLDQLPFEEEPLQETSKSYFAIAGGYVGNFFFVDYNDLNTFFNDNFSKSGFKLKEKINLEAPMIQNGGTGFVGIPWVKNLRVAVQAVGGNSNQVLKLNDTIATNSLSSSNVRFQYSVSSQSINFDYGIVLMNRLAVLPGIGLGFGTQSIEIAESEVDAHSPEHILGGEHNYYYTKFTSSTINFTANLNIEYALTQFAAIRANINYFAPISEGDWFLNGSTTDKVKFASSPINSGGVSAQFGIFLGLFNY